MKLQDVKDSYDFSSNKYQNFVFNLTVTDEILNQSKMVEVTATCLHYAMVNLSNNIKGLLITGRLL